MNHVICHDGDPDHNRTLMALQNGELQVKIQVEYEIIVGEHKKGYNIVPRAMTIRVSQKADKWNRVRPRTHRK